MKTFKMAKTMCSFGFLVAEFLHVKKNIARFLYLVLARSQKCEGILNFYTFISCYYKIWLNYIMDDHQFSYITDWKKIPCSGYQDLSTYYWKREKNNEWSLALAHHSLDLSSIKIESAAYQSLKKGKQNEGGGLLP
jgi:hypothetical protein